MLFDLICYAFFQCLFSAKNPRKIGAIFFPSCNYRQLSTVSSWNICHQHDLLRIENLIKMFHETVHHNENWLMRLKLLPKPQKIVIYRCFLMVWSIRSMNRRYLPKLLRHMLDGCHGQGIWQWLQHWLLCNKNYDLHLQFLK